MHQMAFVYDLLFQSKIVSGFTKHPRKNAQRVFVGLFTTIFAQCIYFALFLFIHLSIYLAARNHKSKQSAKKEKKQLSHITNTYSKQNEHAGASIISFSFYFRNFDSSECVQLFIVFILYTTHIVHTHTDHIHLDL